jgi:GT2 family glycosyltransferase
MYRNDRTNGHAGLPFIFGTNGSSELRENNDMKTLYILPVNVKEIGANGEHRTRIEKLMGGSPDIFSYDEATVFGLKRLLSDRKYEGIVIGFPYSSAQLPDIQIVRSLCPESTLVLYCPTPQDSSARPELDSQGDCDLKRWHELGKTIQLNMCRQADLIIVHSGEEQRILGTKLRGIRVVSVADIDEGNMPMIPRAVKKTSVIVRMSGQLTDTHQCMDSLRRYTRLQHELLCIDNGSSDATRDYLEGLALSSENVRLIFDEKNSSFARATNQGMRIAAGDYVLLLNNDVVVSDGWLDRMIACAESDPSIGIVGPCTNHAAGRQLVEVPSWQNEADLQKFARSFAEENAGGWCETPHVIGFCMLIKREVIEKIGLLDERFGSGGFEDHDFCLRAQQAGYKIMVAGDVFVYQIDGQGQHKNNPDYDSLRHRNVQLFVDKWCRRAMEVMEKMPDGR